MYELLRTLWPWIRLFLYFGLVVLMLWGYLSLIADYPSPPPAVMH